MVDLATTHQITRNMAWLHTNLNSSSTNSNMSPSLLLNPSFQKQRSPPSSKPSTSMAIGSLPLNQYSRLSSLMARSMTQMSKLLSKTSRSQLTASMREPSTWPYLLSTFCKKSSRLSKTNGWWSPRKQTTSWQSKSLDGLSQWTRSFRSSRSKWNEFEIYEK